jgi:hypothetical protein
VASSSVVIGIQLHSLDFFSGPAPKQPESRGEAKENSCASYHNPRQQVTERQPARPKPSPDMTAMTHM